MSIILRDYQVDLIDRTRIALRKHKRVLIQLPTGGGKTALSAAMLGTAAKKGAPSLFVVHRKELIDQTSLTFDQVGILHSYCAAGYHYNPMHPTLICGIDTLKNRTDQVLIRKLIVWDECHHIAAAGWKKVQNAFPDAMHIGLSATPERLDGKGLDDHFDDMICGPSVEWLIQNGFLVDYKAYAPMIPDLSKVGSLAGDFKQDQLAAAMEGNEVAGGMVDSYLKYCPGARCVVFNVNVDIAIKTAAMFNSAGIPAASLDGTSEKDDRKDTIGAFRRGESRVLCNVNLFGEGFDLPAMEAVILGRPTMSEAMHKQQVGRVLRTHPGKLYGIILDHAGNLEKHGLPDDERTWTLAGRDKGAKKGEVSMYRCPECYHCHPPAPTCPSCGHSYRPEENGGRPRIIHEVEREMVEIDKEALKKARAREQGMARSVEELVSYAQAQGMKEPLKWAAHVWTARQAAAKKREREMEAQFDFYRR